MTDIIVKDIKNGSEYYYGGDAEVSAEDVSYDNTTSGMTADNVQDALDEVFQSVSNGKELIADAITDKGVSTSATDSFQTMASNIRLIGTIIPGTETTPIIAGDYTLLRGPCDEGYHVPLVEELQAIFNSGISVTQVSSFLHMSTNIGYRNYTDGEWDRYLTTVYLWSVSPYNSSDNSQAYCLSLYGDQARVDHRQRSIGCAIRGFRDTPIIPDGTRSEIIQGKVWHNSEFGLISVLVGTNQYVTLQDKNVGATSIWCSGEPVNNANRGKYFQWGNNYGFTRNSTGDTSSTKVDASTYGPTTPYSSNTFIKVGTSGQYDWSTVHNNNLRGYEDFTS